MAAGDFHFYSKLFTDLSAVLANYVQGTTSNVIGSITPVATTLISIYVMLWGWSMMRGVISEPITDGVTRIVRLTVITAIALSWGRYNHYVADFLWTAPDAMAGVVAGAGAGGGNQAIFLDTLMNQIFAFGEKFRQKAMASPGLTPDFGFLIVALLIFVVGVIATGYAAFLLCLAKMALAILLAIGPIFVLLVVFEPTKKFFDSWLGQACNYVFLAILTAAAVKMILSILESYLADHMGMPSVFINQAIPCIALCLIGALVMMQLPSISSALGGGVAVSTLGAVGWAYNKMKGATSGGVNLVSGKSLSDMRAARRAKLTNARWAQRNPSLPARATGAAAGMPKAIYRKITGSSTNRVARG